MIGVFRSLEPSDISITPFQAYKEWNSLSDFSFYSASYGTDSSFNLGPFIDTFDIGTSAQNSQPTTSGGYYQRVVYNSIDHAFYRNYYQHPYKTLSDPYIGFQTRDLRQKAKVIGISQTKVGEGILKSSARLTISGSEGNFQVLDDGYGNLYLDQLSNLTSSLISQDDQLTHWQFYDIHKYIDQPSITYTRDYFKGDYYYKFNLTNVVASESFYLNESPAPYFSASLSSSIEVVGGNDPRFIEALNFREAEFGISLMLYPSSTNTNATSSVLAKNGKYSFYAENANGRTQEYINTDRYKYPYQIQMMSSSAGFHIEGLRSNGNQLSVVSSSAITADTWHHILYAKSGSNINLYVDGALEQSSLDVTDAQQDRPENKSNVFVGSVGGDSLFLEGAVSEILFIEKAPSTSEITTLAALSGSNTTRIGNVFYEQGMMVISDPRYAFYDVESARVRGTHTIYEYQVQCTSPAGEHNLTFNPSVLRYDTRTKSKVLKNEFTESFTPYVTSIGLYDDDNNLLAVGKLPNPTQKIDNLDITYVIKFDR